ncbi:MAG: hypothetical protein MnENMB40S_24920 [Rhizobiaceae bacterium MnEN-MB40S]|nr:MAG: hypothetical protein MnENMB40S_24920 [Rhizobiaceae bacterium MnEN-MB40S]
MDEPLTGNNVNTKSVSSISQDRIEHLVAALKAIVDRSHNGELGTSKVIDMRKIAQAALKDLPQDV